MVQSIPNYFSQEIDYSDNRCFQGYYNENYVVSFNGKKAILRIPALNDESVDIRIIPENDVLLHLEKHHFPAPRVIAQNSRYSLHSYVEGDVLEDIYPNRSPFPDWIAVNLARQMKSLHKIPWGVLEKSDTEFSIFSPNTSLFFDYLCYYLRGYYTSLIQNPSISTKFAQVFPVDPFAQIPKWRSQLTARPFVLGHCDIHRKNIIANSGGLVILDWELALITDPCYDIAVHFSRMHYHPHQETLFLQTYLDLPWVHPDFHQFREQIQIYRNIEWIKSAMVDLVRYSQKFPSLNVDEQAQAFSDYLQKLNLARNIWNLPSISDLDFFLQLLCKDDETSGMGRELWFT